MASKSESQPQTPRSATPTAAPAGVVAEAGRPMRSAEDYAAEVAAEYGEYVAVEPIYVGNALAYNVGDPVPKSNVDTHGYLTDRKVARRSTQAGADASAASTETETGLS